MINSDYLKNNVTAVNQAEQELYLGDVNNKNAFRVLFFGNSITFHKEKSEIGWFNNCGMAASKPENDYVHIVFGGLKKKSRKDVAALISNISDFERDYRNENNKRYITNIANEFKADLIIFNIGENIVDREANLNDIRNSYEDVIKNLVNETKTFVLVNLFWRDDMFNDMLEELAKKYVLRLVDISDIGDDDKNKAIGLFVHQGVSVHPGDLGMRKIAEKILSAED